MSMELRRLEAMVKEIHEEMLFLRTREEEMRDLNGACGGGGVLPSTISVESICTY
jgi:uncharacterized Fe-S cluster-containing radical SAM superfamily protein